MTLDHELSSVQGPAVINLSDRAKWTLTGADRVRYLNGQVTNDIVKLPTSTGCRAGVLNVKGKFQGEIWVSKSDDTLWLDAPLELRESLGARLERYIVSDDAVLEDVTERWSLWHYLECEPATPGYASQRFLRPGTDLWLPSSEPIPDCSLSPQEIERLRIEQGIPRWGSEIDENSLVPEVNYDQLATSYTKGCYIGQEVVARLKSIGRVNYELRRLSGPPCAELEKTFELPAPLLLGESEAGRLTSAAVNPFTGRAIGLGLIHRNYLEPGTELESTEGVWKVLERIGISSHP